MPTVHPIEGVVPSNHVDVEYAKILTEIMENGRQKPNRTGTGTMSISGYMFEHNMADGFPLLTTKRIAWKTLRVELEGFIKGITDKKWFQERGCHIWDEWCSPNKVPYGHDADTQAAMAAEPDLGPIYGFQWRRFNKPLAGKSTYILLNDKLDKALHTSDVEEVVELIKGPTSDPKSLRKAVEGVQPGALILHSDWAVIASERTAYDDSPGVDQLAWAIEQVKTNPQSRRIIVNAWNPQQLGDMALVPCHYAFQLLVNDGVLDLLWSQR